MMLNLIEVYEEILHHNKAEGKKYYHLREVVINKHYITFMREDTITYAYHQEGRLPEGLSKDQKFTRISIARGNIGQDLVVVGDLQHITSLFNHEDSSKRKTLKG